MKSTKTLSIMLFFFLAILTISCKKSTTTNGSTGKTGTFSINGTSFSGNVSIQTFVNNNYSILCEQDSPYGLLQITFHNQAEAEAGGTFDVSSGSTIDVPSGEVDISIDGLTYRNDGIQSIAVSAKKITINNVLVKQTGGGSLKKTINSASINF